MFFFFICIHWKWRKFWIFCKMTNDKNFYMKDKSWMKMHSNFGHQALLCTLNILQIFTYSNMLMIFTQIDGGPPSTDREYQFPAAWFDSCAAMTTVIRLLWWPPSDCRPLRSNTLVWSVPYCSAANWMPWSRHSWPYDPRSPENISNMSMIFFRRMMNNGNVSLTATKLSFTSSVNKCLFTLTIISWKSNAEM